jgi:hypothetical protein
MMPNFVWALQQTNGKYIAICEGDDYWTDPYKLQKQVDFLEENNEYNFSMGKVFKFYEDTKKKLFYDCVDPSNKGIYSIKDYIKGHFSHTSTFLMRNNFDIPKWFDKIHAGDQSIVIIATGDKKIKYHNDFFSVYRINTNSISFNTNNKIAYEKSLFFLNKINEQTNFQFNNIIKVRKLNNFIFYKMKQINIPFFNLLFKIIMRINSYLIKLFF